ncbi:MAG: DUF2207 domain-containing protein [Lachnospiraceae bacterium]|nr:DUF2207 domain-containing protein [Lachnospiraceae bacterium]
MKQLKKLTAVVFAVLVLLGVTLGSTITAYAADNHVTNIDIEVVIRNDGSAVVTQYWTGEFEKGTENYLPIRTGDIGISEFSVSDENGPYTFVEDWDVDWNFKKKAGKCGIVETKDGVELCFGITEYGHKEYTFSYVVTDFIKGYRDANGTNFMFINPEMSTFPTAGRIEIVMEDGTQLNDSNAGIWAFGFEGRIEFQAGRVVAYTEKDLEDDNSMIVMLELDKELLSPRKLVTDEAFAAVREEAMEDSDYGHGDGDGDDKAAIALVAVIFGGAFAAVVGAVAYSAKVTKENKEFADSVGYFADVPNGGDIEMTHYLARQFGISKEDSLIMGALMLSMMNKNCLELRETADTFGTAEPKLELHLIAEPDTAPERKLFYILAAAADGTGVLKEKALEDYSYEHYEEIEKFIKDTKKNGETAFRNKWGFVKTSGSRIKHLSETGRSELAQVVGLKKYLEESAQMSERDIWEANLWQEYMVYATLFGCAEDVIEQLKRLYPDRLPVLDTYHHRYVWCYGYYHGMHNSVDRAAQDAAASGSGGSSSVGGGGGFSGGGAGGGSR